LDQVRGHGIDQECALIADRDLLVLSSTENIKVAALLFRHLEGEFVQGPLGGEVVPFVENLRSAVAEDGS
jgi:hypothetical protein